MGKIRVLETKTYVLEKDTGESFKVSIGDMITLYLNDGRVLNGTVCYPPRIDPFTICIKNNDLGYITIRWDLINYIVITGYDKTENQYKESDWITV